MKSIIYKTTNEENRSQKRMTRVQAWAKAAEREEYGDQEEAFRIRITWLWSRKPTTRPKNPRALYRLLRDCYCAPLPEYIMSPRADWLNVVAIDKAYDRAVAALKALDTAAPVLDYYHRLPHFLTTRIGATDDSEAARRAVFQLNALLPSLVNLPKLPARIGLNKPEHGKDSYSRDIVRTVCWYLVNFEKKEPTIDSGNGEVTSLAASLCEYAFAALDLEPNNSFRYLIREVKAETRWRERSYTWWHNLPTSRRADG